MKRTEKIRSALQTLRDSGEINATVYLIHEGREYLPTHQRRQEEFGAYAVQQAGADLVIMHQAHVLQGIRILENRGIFYSLGNFVYGGDTTVRKDKNADTNLTMVVQARRTAPAREGRSPCIRPGPAGRIRRTITSPAA